MIPVSEFNAIVESVCAVLDLEEVEVLLPIIEKLENAGLRVEIRHAA